MIRLASHHQDAINKLLWQLPHSHSSPYYHCYPYQNMRATTSNIIERSNLIQLAFHTHGSNSKHTLRLQFGMYVFVITLQPCPSLQLIHSDLNQRRRQVLFCLLNKLFTYLNQQHICVIQYDQCLLTGLSTQLYQVKLEEFDVLQQLSVFFFVILP